MCVGDIVHVYEKFNIRLSFLISFRFIILFLSSFRFLFSSFHPFEYLNTLIPISFVIFFLFFLFVVSFSLSLSLLLLHYPPFFTRSFFLFNSCFFLSYFTRLSVTPLDATRHNRWSLHVTQYVELVCVRKTHVHAHLTRVNRILSIRLICSRCASWLIKRHVPLEKVGQSPRNTDPKELS